MLLPCLHKDLIEAGCDEAGRGCLAGAVYAASVILPADYQNDLLNDSKKLTERQRYALREVVEGDALAWAVGIVLPEEIDKINILNIRLSLELQKVMLFVCKIYRPNNFHLHRQGAAHPLRGLA